MRTQSVLATHHSSQKAETSSNTDLGRRELPVRFCILPAKGSNLGELAAGERPTEPLDLPGDCLCCDLAGDCLRFGEG